MTTEREHRQDELLASRAAGGDEGAWREIYESSCQSLFSLLCFQVGDREAAKDLLQDTYVTALSKLDRYRGEGPLGAWLRSIAVRKSIDWRRAWIRRTKQRLALAAESTEPTPPSQEPRFDAERAAFQNALDRLSPKQRAALILREVEDLSFREIASTLRCREATARVHYHRAREGMRRMLTGDRARAIADEMEGLQP